MRSSDLSPLAASKRADAVAALEAKDEDRYEALEGEADALYDLAGTEGFQVKRVPRLVQSVHSAVCLECGTEFWPQRKSAKYDTEACKKRAKRKRAA